MSTTAPTSKDPATRAKEQAAREAQFVWVPYPPSPTKFEVNQFGHLRTRNYPSAAV